MIDNKKVLGIIPARGGSKGVPKKNIKEINGSPLICYSILEAKKSQFLTRTIVSTDSEEIASVSKSAGADVPFLRPKEFATDQALSIDVVKHALNFLKENEGEEYDYVVLLQPTTPLRRAQDIDKAITLLNQGDMDTVVSMVDVGANHPARMYTIEDGELKSILDEKVSMMPRQELQPVYIRSGDIYACSLKTIEKYNSMMGKKCAPLIIPPEIAVNIDTQEDFELAEKKVTKCF